MKKVKYKGNKTLNIPFTEEELKALAFHSIETGKTKYEIIREYIFSQEFLTIK
jgi:hypothetical protein